MCWSDAGFGSLSLVSYSQEQAKRKIAEEEAIGESSSHHKPLIPLSKSLYPLNLCSMLCLTFSLALGCRERGDLQEWPHS